MIGCAKKTKKNKKSLPAKIFCGEAIDFGKQQKNSDATD